MNLKQKKISDFGIARRQESRYGVTLLYGRYNKGYREDILRGKCEAENIVVDSVDTSSELPPIEGKTY